MNFLKLTATLHQPMEVRTSTEVSVETVAVDELIAMMSQKDEKVSKVFHHQGLSSDQEAQMYCNNQECNKFQVDEVLT
jgi:hypothetical protein